MNEKLKNKLANINVKALITVVVLIFIIAITALISLVDVGFDISKFDFNKWLSNTLILVIISISGMIIGELSGGDRQKSNPNGKYRTALNEYVEVLNSVELISIYLSDFLVWFKENETKKKCINYLTNNGIKEARDIVEYLDLDDVDTLLVEPVMLSNGKVVRKKTEEQIEAIRKVLSGKISVKANSSSYYLNAFENSTTKSELEIGYEIDKEILSNRRFNRFMKIITGIIFSLIFATMTIRDFIGDDKNAKVRAITTLLVRLGTLFGSILSGWGTSVIDVVLQAKKIENKTSILTKFKNSYESGEFKPISYENLALQEYEEYQKNKKVVEDSGEDKTNNEVVERGQEETII